MYPKKSSKGFVVNSAGVVGVVCSRASASSGNETDDEEVGKMEADIVGNDRDDEEKVVGDVCLDEE